MQNKTGYFEIKDEILYHTTADTMFKVGDEIECGNRKAGMYNRVYERTYTIDGKSIYDSEHHVPQLKNYKLISGKKVNKLNKVIDYYDFTVRELALEQVRKESFKKCPSRIGCLYACNNLDDALNWFPLISWNKEKAQLLKLKCTGKLFIGDTRLNTKENFSFNYYLEQAQKYWNGEVTKEPRFECLFEGKAEVVEIIKQI